MGTDPLLLHRVFNLADWLEVDASEISVADEEAHHFTCKRQTYCVLAEEELAEILNACRKPGPQLSTRTIVEKMHLPFVRRLILERLGASARNPVCEADALLLRSDDAILNRILETRKSDFELPSDELDDEIEDEERAGRFFIYTL